MNSVGSIAFRQRCWKSPKCARDVREAVLVPVGGVVLHVEDGRKSLVAE